MRIDSRLSSLRSTRVIAALSVAFFLSPNSDAGALRTVALTGQPAVGMPAGVIYSDLGYALLNNAGQVAFGGKVAGAGVDSTNENATWSGGQGSLALVARSGSSVPGIAGAAIKSSGPTMINDVGQTAVYMEYMDADSDVHSGYWLHGPNGLESILHGFVGKQAAGLPEGVAYKSVGVSNLNNAGQVLLRGIVEGPGENVDTRGALWTASPGNVQLLALEDDQAPDAPEDIIFRTFDQTERRALNDSGHATFFAGLSGPGVTSANNRGILSGPAGALRMVAREGSPIPGMPAGVNFGTVTAPSINSAGKLAFAAGMTGGDTGAGLFVGTSEGYSLVARSGDPVPAAGAGVNLSSFWPPVMNDQGQVVFHGFLSGPGVNNSNQLAIFRGGGAGAVQMIARYKDPAPGLPAGIVFDYFGAPAINGRGQIAFGAYLLNGVEYDNDQGIWATDAAGELRLIVREGDQLEVAPGDFRIVSYFSFSGESGDSDGRPSAFNDLGQVAFTAFFTDGSSGLFVSDLVATLSLPGDYNSDGAVDAADYAIWRNTFGSSTDLRANGDDTGASDDLIDQADYAVWKQNFGRSGGASIMTAATPSVPEPAAVLLILGALPFVARHRQLRFNYRLT